MNIDELLSKYRDGEGNNRGLQPEERFASFDYCFNHFQQFRDAKDLPAMADATHLQSSCLQLAFYLASWGMFRGSSFLLEKSAKFFEPLIHAIASIDEQIWALDVDKYSEESIDALLRCADTIRAALGETNKATDTLVTKIMLGVFGNVPAFDENFRRGFNCYSLGKTSLKTVKSIYDDNKAQIDGAVIYTFDFSGTKTSRRYTKAKIIDMIGFVKGRADRSSVKGAEPSEGLR